MRQSQLLCNILVNTSIFELNFKGKYRKSEKDDQQVYEKLDHSLYI